RQELGLAPEGSPDPVVGLVVDADGLAVAALRYFCTSINAVEQETNHVCALLGKLAIYVTVPDGAAGVGTRFERIQECAGTLETCPHRIAAESRTRIIVA